MHTLSRRNFITTSAATIIAAPAIVRARSLMAMPRAPLVELYGRGLMMQVLGEAQAYERMLRHWRVSATVWSELYYDTDNLVAMYAPRGSLLNPHAAS